MPNSDEPIIYGAFPAGTFEASLRQQGFQHVHVAASGIVGEAYTYKIRMRQEGNPIDDAAVERRFRDVVTAIPSEQVGGTQWEVVLCIAAVEGAAIAAIIRVARVRP